MEGREVARGRATSRRSPADKKNKRRFRLISFLPLTAPALDFRGPSAPCRGQRPGALLLGFHDRDWVRTWVQRICDLALVPAVTAHGMRGLHSTLALEAGVTGSVVAASLGHEHVSTTVQSYAKPEAVAGAQQRRTLKGAGRGRRVRRIRGGAWRPTRDRSSIRRWPIGSTADRLRGPDRELRGNGGEEVRSHAGELLVL